MKIYRTLKPIPIVIAMLVMLIISVVCLKVYRQQATQVEIWDHAGHRVAPNPYKDTDTTMHVYDNKTKQMIEIERQPDGTWQPK